MGIVSSHCLWADTKALPIEAWLAPLDHASPLCQGNDLVLVAALGIDADCHKHPLGLVEGVIEKSRAGLISVDQNSLASFH